MEPTPRLVDPCGIVRDRAWRLAPRRPTLDGAVVGLVGVTRETVERVGELLMERHGVDRVVLRVKDDIAEPLPEATFAELRELVDCLVVGVGV